MVRSYRALAALGLLASLYSCSSGGPNAPASVNSPAAAAGTSPSASGGADAGEPAVQTPAKPAGQAGAGGAAGAMAVSNGGGGGMTPPVGMPPGPPAAGAAAGAPTPGEPLPSAVCTAMVAAAKEFIASLDTDALKAAVMHPYDRRHNFAYEPQVPERPGASLAMMSETQQQKALAVLRTGLSEEGFKKAETVRMLENLKAVTGFQVNMRDPKYYWLAIFGDPSETGAWGWQWEGHHLALHYNMNACAISDTPTFFGAWPAEVATMMPGGPPAGSRNLTQEEELGRVLARSLDGDPQKRMQAFVMSVYRQMLPQGPDKATPMTPTGIPASAMSEGERTQLREIVAAYAAIMPPELAAARMKRIEAHGGFDKVSVAWSGSVEPKQRHFYRIQGESFMIEYRNDDGNHIHSVWRDFRGDFGDDL